MILGRYAAQEEEVATERDECSMMVQPTAPALWASRQNPENLRIADAMLTSPLGKRWSYPIWEMTKLGDPYSLVVSDGMGLSGVEPVATLA